MLKVKEKAFEKFIVQILNSDTKEVMREFSKDFVFFYSLLKDISGGEGSPNYDALKKVADDKRVSGQFIVERARFLISCYFSEDESGEDYYKTLNVSPDASEEEIRKNWLASMKTYHPDIVGDRGLDSAKRLNEAYEVLGNFKKRTEYDSKSFPALQVVLDTTWTEAGFKKLVYTASLTVFICMAIYYALDSVQSRIEKNLSEASNSLIESDSPVIEDIGEGVRMKSGGQARGSLQSEEKTQFVMRQSPAVKSKVIEGSVSALPKDAKIILAARTEKDVSETEAVRDRGNTKRIVKPEFSEGNAEVEQTEPASVKDFPKQEPEQGTETAGSFTEEVEYKVAKGDTLFGIAARRFNISVGELRKANGLKSDKIKAGQVLKIPYQANDLERAQIIEEIKQSMLAADNEEKAETAPNAVPETEQDEHGETAGKETPVDNEEPKVFVETKLEAPEEPHSQNPPQIVQPQTPPDEEEDIEDIRYQLWNTNRNILGPEY